MMNPTNVSLVLSLFVVSGSSTGCDASPEPIEQLMAPGTDHALTMWPPSAARTSNAGFDLTAAPESVAKNPQPKEKLVKAWMRWAMSVPWLGGPITDTTGEHCAMGQDGPVWFLAGTGGGSVMRECDIPAGKQLFFPLINRWIVFFPEYYPTDESIEEVLPLIVDYYDSAYGSPCALTLRLDGEEILPDLETLHEELFIRVFEPFDVELHDEHWASKYGLGGGSMKAITEGEYARLPPLTPGDHLLELGGTQCEQPFQTAATYLLHVGD